jgi:hypothetical protein
MYDFYFGTREEIARDETKFLIAIKRMMPRWVNSIADSEFIALARLLDEQGARLGGKNAFVAVETGAGASSLALAFYAMKYDGIAYSWDINGEKGSLIRQVCTETMCNYFRQHIDDHWKLIAYDSLSPYLGLAVLGELVEQVDLSFHDSEHVWDTLGREVAAVMPLLAEGGVVALDDANQDFLHTNMAYVNTFRRKYGLGPLPEPEGNRTERFYVKVEKMLKEHWEGVEHLPDLYKEMYLSDPYFSYYNAEFEVKARLGTERTESLEHRFDSWRVWKRLKGGSTK